jgi:hypothetical protein
VTVGWCEHVVLLDALQEARADDPHGAGGVRAVDDRDR